MAELIEKQAALYALCEDCKRKYGGLCPHEASKCIEYRAIKNIHSIEAEPVRHGRWIPTKLKGYYECSACRYEHTSNPAQRFCSYCGARMDGGGNNVLDK